MVQAQVTRMRKKPPPSQPEPQDTAARATTATTAPGTAQAQQLENVERASATAALNAETKPAQEKKQEQEQEEEGAAGPLSLIVHVLSASGLPKMDLNGKADPYIVLKCGKAKVQKSKVVPKSLSPVWNDAHFQFSAVEESDELVVTMFDKDKGCKDDPMGEVRVPVSDMDGQERPYILQPTKGCKAPKGEIVMSCVSVAPAAASTARRSSLLRPEPGSPVRYTRTFSCVV